jgi:hypothetical protein
MDQQQQNQLLQQALQQIAQLQEQVVPLQLQNQLLQQQIDQLRQQQAEEIESDDDDDDDDEEEDDDPLLMAWNGAMRTACQGGDVETISSLLDAGKSVDCVTAGGTTPLLVALCRGQLLAAIMLVGRGADLSRVSNDGSNVLHYAALGGHRQCIELVLANTSIDVNATTCVGWTPIKYALMNNRLDEGKLLVEKGANLFIKNNDGESAMDYELGPQVLQHAKDLIWESVKSLLLLSKACSTSTPSTSLIKVFSISVIVRDYIAPYIMRKGLIIRDPEEDVDEEPEPDEVKLRIESALAAASSSSSISSSSVKRAREEKNLV